MGQHSARHSVVAVVTQRILFVTSTRIGDAVLASGVLKRLVDENPKAEFTIVCGPLAAPLFEQVPRLERVIPMPKKSFGLHWAGLWASLVGQKWDLIVDIRRSLTGYFLRHGQVRRLGPTRDTMHRVELLSSVLGDGPTADPFIFSSPQHKEAAVKAVGEGPLIGIGLGASRRDKIWLTQRFAELAQRLLKQPTLSGAQVVIFGGPGEEPLSALFMEEAESMDVINLVGRTHLLTAHACFERLALFVGNDSGLMHLAASAGCPTLGLFGHTKGHLYGPWGHAGSFVQAVEFGPVAELPVDQVEDAAINLLRHV